MYDVLDGAAVVAGHVCMYDTGGGSDAVAHVGELAESSIRLLLTHAQPMYLGTSDVERVFVADTTGSIHELSFWVSFFT